MAARWEASRTGDPVADLIVSGRASTVAEAENLYLDEHLADLIALVESDLTDAAFRRHPLVALLLARGSRSPEDSLR
jgi:hypothetical protein